MNRQFFAVRERIPLVVMRRTEAQLLVVGDRPRHIRDHEDRLDTDDASHTEIIGTRPTLVENAIGLQGTFPDACPSDGQDGSEGVDPGRWWDVQRSPLPALSGCYSRILALVWRDATRDLWRDSNDSFSAPAGTDGKTPEGVTLAPTTTQGAA